SRRITGQRKPHRRTADRARAGALCRGGLDLDQTAAQIEDAGDGAPRLGGGRDRLGARRASRDAGQFASDPRRQPADRPRADQCRIGGFATEYGGREGHTAIMARALGLPAVLGIPGLLDHARAEAPVIVDGTEGAVILDPAPETVRAYKARQQEVARERRLLN